MTAREDAASARAALAAVEDARDAAVAQGNAYTRQVLDAESRAAEATSAVRELSSGLEAHNQAAAEHKRRADDLAEAVREQKKIGGGGPSCRFRVIRCDHQLMI